MRRIMYIFSLVGSLIFVIMYSRWISWYLFLVLLLMIPFDMIVSLPGMFSRKLLIEVPNVVEQHAKAVMAFKVVSNKRFPARHIKIKVSIKGHDSKKAFLRCVCSAANDSESEVLLDTTRCGAFSFEAGRMWTCSLLGTFSLPSPISFETSVLVLPPPTPPAGSINLPSTSVLRPKPGGGFADDHDIRPYRPGDPIRSIHWKVSAKLNSPVIREPLISPMRNRLIRISKWETSEQCELILGRVRWVSDYLLERELPYYVTFGTDGMVGKIEQNEDLLRFLYNELCRPTDVKNLYTIVSEGFSWEYTINAAETDAASTTAHIGVA